MLDDVVLVKIYENLMLPEQLRMETVSKRSQKISLATWASQEINVSISLESPFQSCVERVTINRSQDFMKISFDGYTERRVRCEAFVFEENLDCFRKRFRRIDKLTVYLNASFPLW